VAHRHPEVGWRSSCCHPDYRQCIGPRLGRSPGTITAAGDFLVVSRCRRLAVVPAISRRAGLQCSMRSLLTVLSVAPALARSYGVATHSRLLLAGHVVSNQSLTTLSAQTRNRAIFFRTRTNLVQTNTSPCPCNLCRTAEPASPGSIYALPTPKGLELPSAVSPQAAPIAREAWFRASGQLRATEV